MNEQKIYELMNSNLEFYLATIMAQLSRQKFDIFIMN